MVLPLLRTVYGDLSRLLGRLAPAEQWCPTGCAGWTPVDLGWHMLADARRGLVALATPADGPPTTDAVGYWRSWQPSAEDDDRDLWATRVSASVTGGLAAIREPYAETVAAVLVSATRVDDEDLVATQGHVLTVADLVSTLAVEAAVHHLDLVAHLDRPGPAAEALAEVRRVLEALLGQPLPAAWDDATAARRGTGREPLSEGDRAALGEAADRLPLFG
ncbi:maleylpyruvate isomerase N-terminal domain-containing protein [Blastococcus sp. URHD0036]|uniref:maleylpyruvate isomerase N-terminal domain-containing protein n=1 Tax=Blastococcus sp. URHD0036 TaxID=1380356 RepID=UPI00068D80DF|nr:maleylpyruvate isomerase N-terminal domain-containing protein [Blastococcus sp. URHD0036]